jgi:hypothetical protein
VRSATHVGVDSRIGRRALTAPSSLTRLTGMPKKPAKPTVR